MDDNEPPVSADLDDQVADAPLAAFLRAVRATPPSNGVPAVAAMRAAARARAATRLAGPAMPTVDRSIDGVITRIYQPGRQPIIVYLHGGGFVVGDLDTHDAQVRRLAKATGTTVVAVHYRRAPERPWPAAVDDACDVITDVARDSIGIVIAGDSAGGLIAVLAALRLKAHVPFLGQLLVCPNIDLTMSMPSIVEKGEGWLLDVADLRRWIGLWMPDTERRGAAEVNPLAADLTGLPRAIVVTAEHDPLRDEGDAYARRLVEAGVPVVHRCEAGLVHNFPTLRDLSPAAAAAEDRFLRDAGALVSAI